VRLLLASQSATRRKMLEQAGVAFETVQVATDEEAEKARLLADGCDAVTIAERLAALKARSVAAGHTELVLGADQVLETADGALLSKPRSREHLAEQLNGLAGTTHRLHSAAMLVRNGELVWHRMETASLTMRPLTDAFIAAYLDREWDSVRWNVGGYRIEGMGAQLFDTVEGSHFAILGLPLLPMLAELRRLGLLAS
jgi:septum formation protein